MKRKYISILLVICMVITMLPTNVFAAESDTIGSVGKNSVTSSEGELGAAEGTSTPPTAAEYAMGAINGTDYTIEGTTLTIKTAKGAAYWSANGLTYLNYTIKLDAE